MSAQPTVLTGSGSGAVQRELRRLASSGLVTVRRVGKQKHYQANPDCPVFEELCALVRKTIAMVEPIRQALAPLAERIHLALIYGSMVKGTDTASSFDLGYNAAHALALGALRLRGYRSESRYLVFQCLQHTIELPNEQWRVLDQAYRKRNLAEYEGEVDVDEQLIEGAGGAE